MNSSYEFSNEQRKYFGLHPVEEGWKKLQLSPSIVAYFNKDRIVKILNWGYVEYDTHIDTIDRKVLLPKTTRGKQQKLTLPRILKIKGSGVQFSGSFLGGNIHVYDNKRNLFFIKSPAEDGDIASYENIKDWVSKYISKAPSDYFEWLADQLAQKKLRVKIEAGNIIAFRLTSTEFGFARILVNVFDSRKRSIVKKNELYWFHPRSIIVAPYAFFSETQNVDIKELIDQPTLPAICIFNTDVYRGEMPVIGHRPLSEKDKSIPFPTDRVTHSTLNITKKDIEAAILLA